MMRNMMIDQYILLAVFLAMVPLGAMAGGNPSAKTPGSQKGSLFESFFGGNSKQTVRSTVQFTPAKSVSTPSASVVNDAPAIAMPSMQSSSLFRHSAAPVGVATRSTSSASQTTSGTSVLGTLSTDRLKRTGGTSGGFSGGAAAGGLMSSGSRYSGGSNNGGGSVGGAYSPSVSDGPRRGFVDDDDPLPTPPVPVGDAVIPLMLLAGAYFIMCVARKRSRALKS
ncbi:MAG: hypothetical protein J6T80_06060 [Paludibacteraceae bacterium]|nr:hypothetical protein [Paludibacteraceae bacterium]